MKVILPCGSSSVKLPRVKNDKMFLKMHVSHLSKDDARGLLFLLFILLSQCEATSDLLNYIRHVSRTFGVVFGPVIGSKRMFLFARPPP